jgi:hypothetical protein
MNFSQKSKFTHFKSPFAYKAFYPASFLVLISNTNGPVGKISSTESSLLKKLLKKNRFISNRETGQGAKITFPRF